MNQLIIEYHKNRYRALCETECDIPLFLQAWWMDAVCNPDNKQWDVFIVENNNEIVAALPYHYFVKLGVKMVFQPTHTQYNGIWIKHPSNQTTQQRLKLEKSVMNQLIDQIHKANIRVFHQNFYHQISNWQPFYWRGFKQTTRYTYIIKNIADTERVFQNFYSFKQKHIKKAQQHLLVDLNIAPSEFYSFHAHTLRAYHKSLFYSEKLFLSIHQCAQQRQQGQIIGIRDENNNLHSAAYVVWDKHSAYYLISAIDPKYKSTGASSLMVWEAIKYLANKTTNFDFEGSMIENVAQSFEEFGAEQTPYFEISKSNLFFSTLIELLKKIKSAQNK
jgi:hypothetical protein